MNVKQLASSAALSAAVIAGGLVAAPTAYGADPGLNGTYRFDFVGAQQTHNGVPLPTADTTSTYTFTTSCGGDGCIARGVLLRTTDREAVSAHNPDVKLTFTDGAWQMSVPYDSPCEVGETRNQLLTWYLTPQQGDDVLTGTRTVSTVGNSCAGDDTGALSQAMLVTRVGDAAPGVAPMP